MAGTVAGYPFVGRRDVLAELREALARAAAGRGGLVTLTGAAGVGKTRTAEELAARADGFRTVWAWCPPGTAGRALRPWSRLLRELVADDVACGRLVAASPPLRALVSGTGEPAVGADPEAARLRLAGDVGEVLATAARRRPLLLVLDDAHAADGSSLRLLLETADAARTAPVLLLATARDDDGAWQDRAWARAQLLGRGRSLPLGSLRTEDVAALMSAATGSAPAPGEVRAVLRRTGGEAFFVTELLRACGGRDGPKDAPPGDGSGPGGSPAAVRAAVLARTGELSPRAARTLEVAAALGTRFRLDVVAEAADVPLEEVRALLGEAAGAGLLADVGADHAVFRHDLLREAVYGGLAPPERAAAHRAIGAVLAAHARRGRDTGPAAVAHHLLLAGPGRTAEAARYAREAAERAAGLLAYEDAADWYERAAEVCADGAALAEVLIGLGAARLGEGRWDPARTTLLRAAALAREAHRPDLLARAALGLGTGPVGFEVDLADREQTDLLAEARAALTGDADRAALYAAVTARLSLASGAVESEERRLALAEEAVRTAREAGDAATLGQALAALCDARPGPDHCQERLELSGEIIATARALPDPVLELLGRRLRLVALLETGAFAAADTEALVYEDAVRPLRRPLYAWYVPLWRGARALREGRFAQCAAALDEVEALGRAAGSANAAVLAQTQRWCLYAETDDPGRAAWNRAAVPGLERFPGLWPRVTLGLLAAQDGRREEAAHRLSAVAPRLGEAPRDSEWLPMMAQAAEIVGAVGHHPSAALLYEALAPYAGLFAVEGIGAAVRGPVDRHLALLARALGRPRDTARHREAALAATRAAGAVALTERIERELPVSAGHPAAPPAVEAAGSVDAAVAVFRREGPLWHLRFAGRDVRVPDSKGLRDLAVLLARPGTPVPAVELASPAPAAPGTVPEGLGPQGDTGELLDTTARAAYRRRLHELEEEAADADARGDAVRAERIAVEREALVGQLSAAYGIGGRVRRTGSPAERARTAVTARIHAAVHRVAGVHPELGRHLETAVRTGTLCVYRPEDLPVWRL
ncbi:ATP-binding protein [Streptomyces sp. NPDC059070]|uniref:ATP-binding protein n=1 Tax=Streptomyces sp. NPDC059070 TaxID=3346713 RepID=UPI003678C0A3